MDEQYIYVRDLRELARVPENGILSQTIQSDERTKVVSVRFCARAGNSRPTRRPIRRLSRSFREKLPLRLGSDEREVVEGTFVYMTPHLEHGIHAKTGVVMLLTMIKG